MNPNSPTEKLYLFYFNDIEKPVKILARSKYDARYILKVMLPNLPQNYTQSVVTNEKVENLLHGISSIVKSGVKYLWHKDRGWLQAANQQ
jgi:hypothetical protein